MTPLPHRAPPRIPLQSQVSPATDSRKHPIRSGRWDSNPRHSAWEADVLPLNYSRVVDPLIPETPDSEERGPQRFHTLRGPSLFKRYSVNDRVSIRSAHRPATSAQPPIRNNPLPGPEFLVTRQRRYGSMTRIASTEFYLVIP